MAQDHYLLGQVENFSTPPCRMYHTLKIISGFESYKALNWYVFIQPLCHKQDVTQGQFLSKVKLV